MCSLSGYLFVVLDCGTGLEEVGAGAVHTGFCFFLWANVRMVFELPWLVHSTVRVLGKLTNFSGEP